MPVALVRQAIRRRPRSIAAGLRAMRLEVIGPPSPSPRSRLAVQDGEAVVSPTAMPTPGPCGSSSARSAGHKGRVEALFLCLVDLADELDERVIDERKDHLLDVAALDLIDLAAGSPARHAARIAASWRFSADPPRNRRLRARFGSNRCGSGRPWTASRPAPVHVKEQPVRCAY